MVHKLTNAECHRKAKCDLQSQCDDDIPARNRCIVSISRDDGDVTDDVGSTFIID